MESVVVDAVICELVSGVFSLFTGNLQGISANFRWIKAIQSFKASCLQWFTVKFPAEGNRESSQPIRDDSGLCREHLFANRERFRATIRGVDSDRRSA